MRTDRSTYTGLPRQEIDWFPRIDPDKCDPSACGNHCVGFCPFGVFSLNGNGKATVSNPYACNVGEESCRFQCPRDAISFPTREEWKAMLRRVRAKYQK